ncbi:uncharacterized protein LOC133919026 isoform X2 [Phragmites australis]|uniref:uncharacterized protein LOC133919026 isoform X2 n=1 Tax=Phragmites australis TaxID=29695 RepID=UPI002D771E3E|nr:uncharacterized protein LOC133919026 isoform X2 [Phragmites australis]
MRRDAAAAAAMEGLQERILDLNDKLRHATLPLSAGRGAPAGRGCVIPKGRRGRGDRCSAVVAGARSLHAIRAALEDLEGHLHCLRDVIVQQQVKRGAAISRLQQSRKQSGSNEVQHPNGPILNIVVSVLSCSLALFKNSPQQTYLHPFLSDRSYIKNWISCSIHHQILWR